MAIPKTHISSGQVLQNAYDEVNQSLRTTSVAVIAGNIDVEVDAADGDNVAISDGTDTMAVNPDGSINTTITNTNIAIELDAADGDNVAISDGTDTLEVNPDGSINVKTADQANNFNIQELLCTLANTEYSFTLPIGTTKFLFKLREIGTVKMYKTSGGAIYYTIPAGVEFESGDLKLDSGLTVYITSSKANSTLEIVYWYK